MSTVLIPTGANLIMIPILPVLLMMNDSLISTQTS